MVRITVNTPLHGTEVQERVQQAAKAFFPDAQIDLADGRIIATGSEVAAFRHRVWELRIIDTVRSAILEGCKEATAKFLLSKQAAFQGRISLPVSPHALGDLLVTFHVEADDPWDDAEALAWWLCPETADGEIVGPMD